MFVSGRRGLELEQDDPFERVLRVMGDEAIGDGVEVVALHRWSRILFVDDVAMPGAVRLEAGELCGCHALATEHPECALCGEELALRSLRQGVHREEIFWRDHELVATLCSHREERVGLGGGGGNV